MSDKPPVLWHIKISHYNEKVRWALDYKRVMHKRRAPLAALTGYPIPRRPVRQLAPATPATASAERPTRRSRARATRRRCRPPRAAAAGRRRRSRR